MPRAKHYSLPPSVIIAMLAAAGCPAEDDPMPAEDDAADSEGSDGADGPDGSDGADGADGADTDDGATDDGATDDGATDDGSVDETGGAIDPEELLMCDEELQVGIPLFGPGIDPETGDVLGDAESYIVSTTQIILRPEAEAQMQFDELVDGVVGQIMMTPGLVGMSFAGEPGCGSARTLTIWEDTAAMYGFTASGAHAEAMTHTYEVGLTGRVVYWEHAAADGPPTWEQALAELSDVGPIPGPD